MRTTTSTRPTWTTIDNLLQAAAGDVDYGPADFNGDGHTSGSTRDRFDFGHNDPPAWSVVRRSVLGLPLDFDENALTDYDVLCFVVQGGLYTGSSAARDTFTEQRCLPPVDLTVVYPSVVTPGTPATLTVNARRTDTGALLEDLPLELTVSGGTLGSIAGFTDPNGDFSTTATMNSGASQIDVTVTAKVGQTVLDTATVTATPAGVTVHERAAQVAAGCNAGSVGQPADEKSPSSSSGSGSGALRSPALTGRVAWPPVTTGARPAPALRLPLRACR